LSTQYCDGLRGAFAVYDPNDPLAHLYDVDDGKHTCTLLAILVLKPEFSLESTVITLADWYHDQAPDAQRVFFESGTVPIPDSGLINGAGRYVGGPEVPFAVVNVKQGMRYRFRIFQLACRPFFTFSIDNHNLVRDINTDL
jgi:iron transport multicopper oxidase